MVELLLVRGAPINARNLAGATALYFASEGGHTPIVQSADRARPPTSNSLGGLCFVIALMNRGREARYSTIQVAPG
jgi:ankyrin repeat protein